MEALVPAGAIIIAGLTVHLACLLASSVMLIRDRAEEERVGRELEALLDRSLKDTTPPVRPGAS